jgi:hypothetical protein
MNPGLLHWLKKYVEWGAEQSGKNIALLFSGASRLSKATLDSTATFACDGGAMAKNGDDGKLVTSGVRVCSSL